MNEEKEDLRRQVERLQGQITNLTNQVRCIYIVFSCMWHDEQSVVIKQLS